MNKIPLELKQRICSFFHDTSIELRLAQADPTHLQGVLRCSCAFLLPRIFLFKHPDSCAEVKEIAGHPLFSKHVTTLIVDLSVLKPQPNLQAWIDDHDHLQHVYPDWWDFKPEDIEYDEDGDPLLRTSQARAKWMDACKEFDKVAKRVTKNLKKSQLAYWSAHQELAARQSTAEFRRCFLDTIYLAFKMCPNLSNLVIAPPQPCEPAIARRYHTYKSIHPSRGSWTEAALHDPSDFEMADLMHAVRHQETGLNSLTFIDLPFRCADYTKIESLEFLSRLKHIRIGWNRLGYNPKTEFGFNLEEVLHKTHSLETIWIHMPPLREDEYVANDLLDAMKLNRLRDIMLDNVSVAEDTLVAFLLRHSDSLQSLTLSITLSDGTWASALRRISNQMKVLERVQFSGLVQKFSSEPMMTSPIWCSEAIDCVLRGKPLSDPDFYDLSEDFDGDGIWAGCQGYRRDDDMPEDGLWEDFDGNVNFRF